MPDDDLSDPTLAAFTVFRAQKPALVLYHADNWSNVPEPTLPSIITRGAIYRGVTILAQAFDDAINRRGDAIRDVELSAGSGSDCERGQASAQTGVVVDAYDIDPRHWLIWDGTCDFCRRSSEWFARIDVRGEFRIVPYQDCPSPPMTPALRAASARAVQVVRADGTVVSGGRAVLFLLREVGWHPRVMAIAARPPLVWLVEIGYRIVAKNRQFFSRLLFRDHSRHLDRPE